MAAVGLRLSSNFNLCYLEKSCRILWPTPANALFDTHTGVYELPHHQLRRRAGDTSATCR
jgi:hypothetical protein